MTDGKKIGLVFIEGFADWEFGLLSASAVEWFGAKAVSLTPDGKPVRSMSGFRLTPDRSTDPRKTDLDAVAVIGSDNWAGKNPPDVAPLLNSVGERGGVVGGICAGTLALARAGLFRGRRAYQQRPRLDPRARARLCRRRQLSRTCRMPWPTADRLARRARRPAPSRSSSCRRSIPSRRAQLAEMRSMFGREYADSLLTICCQERLWQMRSGVDNPERTAPMKDWNDRLKRQAWFEHQAVADRRVPTSSRASRCWCRRRGRIDDFIRSYPRGDRTWMCGRLRTALAPEHGAEVTCPVTTRLSSANRRRSRSRGAGAGRESRRHHAFWRVLDSAGADHERLTSARTSSPNSKREGFTED